MLRRPKRRHRIDFKKYDIKVLFYIRDNLKALFNVELKNKYFEKIQKQVCSEIERRAK